MLSCVNPFVLLQGRVSGTTISKSSTIENSYAGSSGNRRKSLIVLTANCLLTPQTIYRVGKSCFYRLVTYTDHCDQHRYTAG